MTKALMILGTSSGAGKSTIATGISRILLQDGYAVAPFKAQNMSNCAHTLPDGREMARSQAIQAYACGMEPHPDMNPVLLKIVSGQIEVIVCGSCRGRKSSADYDKMKKEIWPDILACYQRVKANCQIVVLEGAGSPVEMNLKQNDFVNIRMAEAAKAPVLLVADIDRGGAFASVYGTLMLLSEQERSQVKGIVINRCRGKQEHLAEVKTEMERITGLPVIGMVPYIELKIEDEDNLIDPATGKKQAQTRAEMEQEFDALARELRQHLDCDRLYEIIEAGRESE